MKACSAYYDYLVCLEHIWISYDVVLGFVKVNLATPMGQCSLKVIIFHYCSTCSVKFSAYLSDDVIEVQFHVPDNSIKSVFSSLAQKRTA